MDADVYGPNVPLMMGVRATPHAIGERIQPIEKHGVRMMSMGFLNPGDKPLVWRGPMLHSVIQQFLRGVDWGELDYLIIDLPPGTGDVQLTLIQTAPLTGAVVVTTPSDVSLEDARKAVHMFQQVRVPILGHGGEHELSAVPALQRADRRVQPRRRQADRGTDGHSRFWANWRSIPRCGSAAIPASRLRWAMTRRRLWRWRKISRGARTKCGGRKARAIQIED